MAEVTLEVLRSELESFAKDALRRELAQLKDDIILELHAQAQRNKLEADGIHRLGSNRHMGGCGSEVVSRRGSSRNMNDSEGTDTTTPLTSTVSRGSRIITPYPRDDKNDSYTELLPEAPLMTRRRSHGDSLIIHRLQSTDLSDRCDEMVLRHPWFSKSIITMICLNVLMFVIQTDYLARNWLSHPPIFFFIFELVCLLVFGTEMVLRISVQGSAFFTSRSKGWHNLFDFCLVVLQLIEAVLSATHICHRNGFIGSLRILRVARILRVGRILHLVPAFRALFVSIMASMESLMWIMLLVFLTSGSFAVVITQVVTDHKIAVGREEIMRNEALLELFFGTVDRSTLKLYQTVTDGYHWADLADPLMEHVGAWSGVFFVVYSAFMVFAMMNIVTAFFVETAMEEAQEDYQKHMSKMLWETFHKCHIDPDKEVTEEEFLSHIDHPAMLAYFKRLGLDGDKATEMNFFKLIDKDSSGSLSGHELQLGCLRLMGPARAIDLAALTREIRLEIQFNEEYRRASARALKISEEALKVSKAGSSSTTKLPL